MQEKQQIALIKDFSNTNGVSGFEKEVSDLFLKKARQFSSVDTYQDGIFNAYANLKEDHKEKPVVQLDAHADSVGFIVQAIQPNGLIKFLPLGGWVPTNIPTMKVRIKNLEGKYVTGVVASKPPHFMTKKERQTSPKISDMSIDVGSLDRKQTIEDFKINIGCPIIPDVSCQFNPKTRMFLGKDFDNRLGTAALINVLHDLNRENLSVQIKAALSVQEELGLRGVKATTRKISPDLGIVFEGCPCDDTFYPGWLSQTGLKKGPMLRDMDSSFIANPRFERFVINLAEKLNIPHTHSVRSGGGVNGAVFVSQQGVPTIVVGIPVRYEHTAYNWANLDDFQNSVKLVTHLLKKLDLNIIRGFY